MPAGTPNRSGAPAGAVNGYTATPNPGAYADNYVGYGNVPAYRAPAELSDHDQIDSPAGAWAPVLRSFPGGVPDPARLNQIPLKDYRPDTGPPEEFWEGPNGPGRFKLADSLAKETIDSDGMRMVRDSAYTWRGKSGPDPRRTPPPEPRLTSELNPHRYYYQRPFDQHAARQFTGQHFSMADHRRTYPILGMAPVQTKRNTYRADPTPWDTGLVDMPDNVPAYSGQNAGRNINAEIQPLVARSFRLT